jgi:putative Mg2+ transporter-C (MgtC) family protein
VAAGVVTGLGFLGAGMILHGKGREIHGLTTAAGIWAAGGMGLAIGAGKYLLGLSSAIFVGLILMSGRLLKIQERIAQRSLESERRNKKKFEGADDSTDRP